MNASSFELTAKQVALHDRQRELGAAGERRLTEVFAAAFPASGFVLDAGGGSGVASAALRAAGLRTFLIDLSWAMLSAAATRLVPRVQGDLRALPLQPESVDGVHAAYVLQNIAEWRLASAEFARVLHLGGTALVAFGAPPADEMVSDLARRYFSALRDAGAARVGVAAEGTGLRSVLDAERALKSLGMDPTGQHVVTGEQSRSLRQLVDQWAGNPFAVQAVERVLVEARDGALRWATQEYGDIDEPRTVQVRHVLHEFRRVRKR
ncbi:MAG: class I SAM-dependent methyltransferase [Pseudonocardiales bacterium]|nr:class I SAM-dependent methyltransferase [Pseudonocardiales bacterium]